MKARSIFGAIVILMGVATLLSFTHSKDPVSSIKEENVTYKVGDVTCNGFIAYDQNIKGKRPGILVVHEWWGLNNYAKMRARKLAELGYIALAVDMFGNGKNAANPQEAMDLTAPFYKDPQLVKARINAALSKLKEQSKTDTTNMAAIGYCFGGSVVLTAAKLGENLKGVVSFHGGLTGITPNKDMLKAKILVCQGGDDNFVPQKDVDAFKHQMDSIGANYNVKVYANATHAFTNPEATEIAAKFNMPIKYNPQADKDSWNDMKTFLSALFKK